MKSVSVEVEPVDARCGYWAKYIGAHLTLKLPSEVQSEHDLPGRALQEGEEELGPGDFLIEGEENHHQFEHGWRYRLSYMGLDGTLQQVRPNTTMKQAMKTAGMPLSLLRGSGQLAACVRLIEGLRQHLVCGVMPMYSSEGPVSADEYANVKALGDLWFSSTVDGAQEPSWPEIVAMAMEMKRVATGGDELQLPTEVFAD